MAGTYLDYLGTGQPVAGGHYRLGLLTGATIGFTANQVFMALRWLDPAHYFVLLSCQLYANIATAFTSAQIVDASLYVARSWSTAPTGGTTIMPMTQPASGKVRDAGGGMQNSLLNAAQLQVSTTAALTPGTLTKDSQPIGAAQFNNNNALGSCTFCSLYDLNYANDHPVVLGVQEGLEIGIPTAQGAVGSVVYYINLRWAEVPQY